MTNIETTAADFCNGSLSDDQARLQAAIATGDKFEIDLMVDTLASEAMNSLQEIVMNAPDEPSNLEMADFKTYYRNMANGLTAN